MINIVELEKRWFRYKKKIYSSLFFVLFFILTIPYLLYYFFEQYTLLVNKNKNVSTLSVENKKITAKNGLIGNIEKSLVLNRIEKQEESGVSNNDVLLAPSIPIIDFKNEKKKDIAVEKSILEKKEREKEQKLAKIREEKKLAYHKKVIRRRALEKKRALERRGVLKRRRLEKKKLVKAKASTSLSSSEFKVVNGNKRVSTAEPKKIHFQRSRSNYMDIMKKKFERNKNPREAILIAKAYYKAGNYVESERWALNANELDKSNEESWFLFAKSKAKLGKKREAIKILASYHKKTKSSEANEIMHNIKSGRI